MLVFAPNLYDGLPGLQGLKILGTQELFLEHSLAQHHYAIDHSKVFLILRQIYISISGESDSK